MRDVAVVSFARTEPGLQGVQESDTQLLFPIINEALDRIGITRKDIGFTCSASCDYLAGAPFAFVQTLEATGAWPPISESHVEMDGAWALYEAWVRLQHGDIDTALVFAAGMSTRGDMREVLSISYDPYYLMPLWLDPDSVAGLQLQALIDAGKANDDVLKPPTYADGAACVILAAGDRAKQLTDRPAWIAGIDHRVDAHYPGVRDLSVSDSARIAGAQAGVDKAPVDVAELHASYAHEEIVLREALGLGDDTTINPSGGARASNPLMVAGLIRLGEAANTILSGDAKRTVGHASSGPCLQQNLVCVMEA
ncbi:MAG: lipid-transfer protein [Actinomycetota bacterium]